MSGAFDPVTGMRAIADEAPAARTRAAARRNPYETALAATWIVSLALAFCLLLGQAQGAAALVAGFALVVGVVHLGVRAVLWRRPED